MRTRSILLLSALAIGMLGGWITPAFAIDTSVTGGAGGLYPPDTAFSGVPIVGLELGFGVIIGSPTIGQFSVVLLGIPVGGVQQRIRIQGEVSDGEQVWVNVAVFSGTGTVDMGDGTPPIPGVPFTATVTTDAEDQGTLGLVIGNTTLPSASVSEGSMTIE